MDAEDLELRLVSLPTPRRSSTAHLEADLLRAPWSHTTRRADGLLEAQLSGMLPASWSLNLMRGLASRGLSVRDGYARRIEPGAWIAQLEIEAPAEALEATALLELATGRPARPTSPEPRLLDFELGDSPAHGGSLALEVHAWDAVGLLAAVLGRADAAGLVATELVLETEDDCAFHHLTLQSRGWSPPTRRERRALSLGLAGLLGGR